MNKRLIIDGLDEGSDKQIEDLKNYLESHEWSYRVEEFKCEDCEDKGFLIVSDHKGDGSHIEKCDTCNPDGSDCEEWLKLNPIKEF